MKQYVAIALSLDDAQALYDHTGTMPFAPGSWSNNVRDELSEALHYLRWSEGDTAEAKRLLEQAWEAIAFTRQPDDAKAVAENRLLARIEAWLQRDGHMKP